VIALQRVITRFYAGVKSGFEKGLNESEIRKTLDLADWEKLERAYVIGRNVNRAYLEIENGSFGQ
jgi:cyclase